jgi:hypothetical protein
MVVFVMMLSGALKNESTAQLTLGVSFQTFYDELSPYGEWIYYPEYGYAWSPDDYRYDDFHPYRSGGHWAWSDDYEWFWVSDYDWGWAPFHYGRWFYDSYYGWLWVPDYDWSPAWVVWRGGGDYYGWAPMRPGISTNLYFGRYSLPNDYWCFAPRQYITSPRIYDHCVDRYQNTMIINNTTIINNYKQVNNVYTTGPSKYEAERYTRNRIQPVKIRETKNPGRMKERNNEIDVYKPSISRQGSGDIAPRRFEQYKQRDINRIDRRNTDNSEIRRDRNTPPIKERRDETNDQPITDNRKIFDQRRTDRQNEEKQKGQRTFPGDERSNNRTDRRNETQQPQSQRQLENPGRQHNRVERKIETQPAQHNPPNFENQGSERRNNRIDSRNNEVQRPQRSYQPQIENQRTERQNTGPDVQRPQRQFQPQIENPRIERQNSRPEMQRPQPQSQPQIENPVNQRTKPTQRVENRAGQQPGINGNGQQNQNNNRGGKRQF